MKTTRPSAWSYTEQPVMTVTVRLACGHVIEATEYDGGMDELPNVGRRILETSVKNRVVIHAVIGCENER